MLSVATTTPIDWLWRLQSCRLNTCPVCCAWLEAGRTVSIVPEGSGRPSGCWRRYLLVPCRLLLLLLLLLLLALLCTGSRSCVLQKWRNIVAGELGTADAPKGDVETPVSAGKFCSKEKFPTRSYIHEYRVQTCYVSVAIRMGTAQEVSNVETTTLHRPGPS